MEIISWIIYLIIFIILAVVFIRILQAIANSEILLGTMFLVIIIGIAIYLAPEGFVIHQ